MNFTLCACEWMMINVTVSFSPFYYYLINSLQRTHFVYTIYLYSTVYISKSTWVFIIVDNSLGECTTTPVHCTIGYWIPLVSTLCQTMKINQLDIYANIWNKKKKKKIEWNKIMNKMSYKWSTATMMNFHFVRKFFVMATTKSKKK